LLHFENQQKIEEKEQEQLERQQPDKSQQPSISGILVSTPVLAENSMGNAHVFLATALVIFRDKNGVHHQCRAILDSGLSEACFKEICKLIAASMQEVFIANNWRQLFKSKVM